jgi:tetratricopeptide (TPR) repeat protein
MKTAFLLLCALSLQAFGGTPDLAAMKAALPGRQGTARLEALVALANALETSAPKEALAFATEGAGLARQAGDRGREAAFLSSMAFSCSQAGDFPMALQHGKEALELCRQLGDRERMAKVHNTLGITYTFIGAYSQALEENLESLRLNEALSRENAALQSLNSIGILYHHTGQYEKALDYYGQILKRIEHRPDPARFILTRLNIGFAEYKLGHVDEALRIHQEALDLSRRTGNTTHIGYAHYNLGLIDMDLGRYDGARRNLALALAECADRDQQHGRVQVLNAMGRLNLLSGTPGRGLPQAAEAADLASRINARDELGRSYELLSDLHGKLGHGAESFRYYRLFVATRDSIFTFQESNRIADASMKLVTLRKDHEIETLKREQVISALQIGKQRYVTILLGGSLAFLGTIIFLLGRYNRRVRHNKNELKKHNAALEALNGELLEKINLIRTLSGLLPICAHCKKIRNDKGYWEQLEGYISQHTSATFSHGICPDCADEIYPEAMERIRGRRAEAPEAP